MKISAVIIVSGAKDCLINCIENFTESVLLNINKTTLQYKG